MIASTQIKDFFGLKIDKVPGDFFVAYEVLGARLSHSISWMETGIALLVLVADSCVHAIS